MRQLHIRSGVSGQAIARGGIFVAVGPDWIVTSRDGKNWNPLSVANKAWAGICWSPELRLFCAVAASNTGQDVMTSPDARVWTLRTTPTDANLSWGAVCWSPQLNLFAACSGNTNANNEIMTSPNAITWTLRTSPINASFSGIAWAPSIGLFASVDGFQNGTDVITSSDGIAWTARTTPGPLSWGAICWSPQLKLFCATAGGVASISSIMTSPDGINWTQRTTPTSRAWSGIDWSPSLGLFATIGLAAGGSSHVVGTSPDGTNWTDRTILHTSWYDVAWSEELKIFVATNFALAAYSLDGITWTLSPTVNLGGPPFVNYSTVAWGFPATERPT